MLPGRARYGAALPGHLAERDWYRRTRVRIVTETAVGAVDPQADRTFRVGEIVTMHQRGNAGREVLRDCWWDSADIDGAHIIPAECAEIVEILQDEPPTWDEAALTAAQVTGLLAPHHPDAAAAAAAWESAGLHVSWCEIGDLAVRTPGPEYRLVGIVPGDYWKGGAFTKPYETVPAEGPGTLHLRRKLDRLPLEPVAAAVRVIDCAGLSERVGHLAADEDLIHNGVWERASDSDREETGPCEHWDYYAIWDAWNYSCHQFLASYGATWDPDPIRGEGTLTARRQGRRMG